MMGKFIVVPCVSLMSRTQPWWDSTGSTEMATHFTLRLANSSLSFATAPNSVVQTGV